MIVIWIVGSLFSGSLLLSLFVVLTGLVERKIKPLGEISREIYSEIVTVGDHLREEVQGRSAIIIPNRAKADRANEANEANRSNEAVN